MESIKNRLRFSQLHCYVWGVDLPSIKWEDSDSLRQYEIKEISQNDTVEIDQITEFDPWKVPKRITIDGLNNGQSCLVAKHEGIVVAYCWTTIQENQYNPHFNRIISFPENESYIFRVVTRSDYRKKRIAQNLLSRHMGLMASKFEKDFFVAIIKCDNFASQKTFENLGFRRIGYTGFYKIAGYRFVYLFGKDAFRKTKKMLFVDKV